MVNALKMRKMKGGVRQVTCVVNGRKVPPFDIYPQAFEHFPKHSDLIAYLERQALAVLNLYGSTPRHVATA